MSAARDLAMFYRSLAEMLRAGVVLDGALESCAHQLPKAASAARVVAQGRPLSEALARFPRIFPADHVRLIHIAERSGSVDATLADLADFTEEMIAARRTLVSGLTLPAFIVHVGVVLGPVPGLVLGQMSLGRFLFAALIPLAVLWGLVGVVVWFARRASAEALDTLLQPMPIVGETWRHLQRWRMAASLRLLARTSLDVPASLRFAASGCADARLSAALRHAAATAERTGTPASAALATTGTLPADVLALWQNAERTGALDAMFTRLATRYADSFRASAQALATWLPRLAYLIVASGAALQILQLAGAYLGYLSAAAE